jgi:hypothetical protein
VAPVLHKVNNDQVNTLAVVTPHTNNNKHAEPQATPAANKGNTE